MQEGHQARSVPATAGPTSGVLQGRISPPNSMPALQTVSLQLGEQVAQIASTLELIENAINRLSSVEARPVAPPGPPNVGHKSLDSMPLVSALGLTHEFLVRANDHASELLRRLNGLV